MQWPESCKFCESFRPRSFAALMDMYEHNYMRLKCLCPSVRTLQGKFVSRTHGAHDLHLEVIEQVKHTTTLQLTYRLESGELHPDVMLRIYHDARQAEVLDHRCRLNAGLNLADASPGQSALLCKWKVNRFLYKWLNYCWRQGHRFDALQTPEPGDVRVVQSMPFETLPLA